MSLLIRPQTQDKIINAIETICKEASLGEEQRTAIKVSREMGLTPHQIRLACQGANTSRINHQRRSKTAYEDKFAAVPLLNADAVVASIFREPGTKVAVSRTVVAPVYGMHGEFSEKLAAEQATEPQKEAAQTPAAAPPAPAPGTGMTAARKAAAVITQGLDELRRRESALQQKYARVEEEFVAAFGYNYSQLPWAAKLAQQVHGPVGGLLVNLLKEKLVQSKTAVAQLAQSPAKQPYSISSKQAFFDAVGTMAESFKSWYLAASTFPKLAFDQRRLVDVAMGRHTTAVMRLAGEQQWEADERLFRKNSVALGGMLTGLAAGAMRRGPSAPPSLSKDLLMARLQLNDPRHEAQLDRIDAESRLNQLLQNDQIIGGHTTEEVADAFDNLAQSTPGLAENPMLLQANLRRNLQGDLTPFEAADAVNTSQKVEKREKIKPLVTLTAGKPSSPAK